VRVLWIIRQAAKAFPDRRAQEVRRETTTRSRAEALQREDLEVVRAAKETLHIQVLGPAVIADDVSPELARETIASIHVLEALQAPPALKAALKDRIH
jgi:Ribbon-Helix-Helix transcriptional regulator family